MKYLAIDLETTGTDPETCQILELCAVLEDTANPLPLNKLPFFRVCLKYPELKGQPFALRMNRDLIDKIYHNESSCRTFSPGDVVYTFAHWLRLRNLPVDANKRVEVVLAGKNVGAFDLQFLKRLPYFMETIRPSHRILDPGNMFIDWATDEKLPDLEGCLKRAGLEINPPGLELRAHDAWSDCIQVIRLLRTQYLKTP